MLNLFRVDPVARLLESVGIPRSAATPLARAGTLLELPSEATLCRVGEPGRDSLAREQALAGILRPERSAA